MPAREPDTTEGAETLPRALGAREDRDSHALAVLYSPDRNALGLVARLPLDRAFALGRRPAPGGLRFEDHLASRSHGSIAWDEERSSFVLRDEGSSNGTQLNGRDIVEELLVEDDIVRMGDTVLRFGRFDLEAVGWKTPANCALKGRSLPLKGVLDSVRRVAGADVSVLVRGETGTGKELIARELHRQSGRPGPLHAINCAAIPAGILESELFGHKKGAFSGATQDKVGMIRAAEGGTLFLDEVGELAPELQAKLLRVLDEYRVRPVGATRDEKIDVRFVFATNRDLAADVDDERFRADLHARIAQWEIVAPPLHERPEDLVPIVDCLVSRFGAGAGYEGSGDFYEALALHDWPYNVRELVTIVRRAIIAMPEGGVFQRQHLPEKLQEVPRAPAPVSSPSTPVLPALGAEPTPRELVRLLRHHGGNVSKVARHTGRDRKQVYRWLRRAGLGPKDYRGEDR